MDAVYLHESDFAGYLKVLFEPGDRIDIKLIHQTEKIAGPDGKQRSKTRDNFQSLETAITPPFDDITKAQDEGWNAFILMNPVKADANRRREQDIAAIRTVYVEFDENTEAGLKKVYADIEAGNVPVFDFVLESSPGKAYVIWRVKDFTVSQQKALNKALQKRYGSDPASVDAARVLRLPGTRNLKYASKPFARIIDEAAPHEERRTIGDFKIPVEATQPVDRKAAPEKVQKHIEYYEQACQDAGVDVGDLRIDEKGQYCYTVACPNWEAHTKQAGKYDAGVIVQQDGSYGFHCFHGHCAENDWIYYRAWMEQQAKENGFTGYLRFGDERPGLEMSQTAPTPAATASESANAQQTVTPQGPWEEDVIDRLDTSGGIECPKFPDWVWHGTSIGEHLIRPALECSSKHSQFLFFPAYQVLLNYLSGKVEIPLLMNRYNTYVLLLSPYGKFFKSSSVRLAHKYFKQAGVLTGLSTGPMNGEGRVVTFKAGSAEGFCTTMVRQSSRNGLLFYDELSGFVSKSNIEGASLGSALLEWYESAPYSNTTLNTRNNFSFEEGTYTFGFVSCTTDRMFPNLWPKVAGSGTGISDRVIFVSAEQAKSASLYREPPLDSTPTRQFIDKAISRGRLEYEDMSQAGRLIDGLNPRSMALFHKFALGFAVDLGLAQIDTDCAERAKAIVDYSDQSLLHAEPVEAEHKDGRLQKEIVREIRKNKGRMAYRDLCRVLDYMRFGIGFWNQAYNALVREGLIIEFFRRGERRPTRMVGLLKQE